MQKHQPFKICYQVESTHYPIELSNSFLNLVIIKYSFSLSFKLIFNLIHIIKIIKTFTQVIALVMAINHFNNTEYFSDALLNDNQNTKKMYIGTC